MKRRKFLVGLGSAGIGGSALIGSGAFSRVDAQRSVTIQAATDPNAYLGMDKCGDPPTPNSSYASIDDNGHLQVLMNPQNPTIGESPLGEGVNSDSRSYFDNVFEICNQGKEAACVYIEDDDSWPTVPDGEIDAGERRVDFYLNGFRDDSLVGSDNALLLDVGECICLGLVTRTFGLSEGDELLGALDDTVRIIADTDGDCFQDPCPVLDGEYQCTVYEFEDPDYVRTGTRFEVFNTGPSGTTFDLAVADNPPDFRGSVSVGANSSTSVVTDASVPQNAVIAWDAPEGCEADLQTWAEYKNSVGVADLTDWYNTFGTGSPPANAPSDFADERVVEVKDIPEQDQDPADTVGPDESIPGDTFPDMSQAAEDLGWVTCEKEGIPDQ
ncbi:Protein of unknown function [Halovenus aranensis]|uniref:DUF1102 domain-containing protein n=1 Tax=Halovenus aranensis TaxID=890420 RepID=A0A1G8ZZ64_9EURY|nr:DUF1102 domain-containing protein [Halovenus aranensis]SDK20396.1 Protein of unknown function [Halovenus aranensis]